MRYDPETQADYNAQANVSEIKDAEAERQEGRTIMLVICRECQQGQPFHDANCEVGKREAAERMGREALEANDKAAGIQSRYLEAQEEVLSLLRNVAIQQPHERAYLAGVANLLARKIEDGK